MLWVRIPPAPPDHHLVFVENRVMIFFVQGIGMPGCEQESFCPFDILRIFMENDKCLKHPCATLLSE